jgi:hypothetical protein
MQKMSIEEIMQKAKEFQEEGKKWHFHMLTPDCMFNERKDKQAFILENETDSQNFVTYSDKRYMEQGQTLVKMLHGNQILKDKMLEEKEDKNIKLMVQKAKNLNKRGINWHHHMLFPDCIFNKHKGKWCIVFEDKSTGKLIESVSDNEPKENLRKIEILYYAQKE